ncbi:MAG: putative membrane protein [Cyclobacteriaceae bacterium]|jgi:putative membrane protein
MNFLIKLLLSTLAVIIASYLLPGVSVDNFLTALIVAFFLSLLNVTLKPLLIILTIPLTVVTLGLFLLVINAVLILIADSFISGFVVSGFWWALLFSFILSLINSLLSDLSKSDQK